MDNLLYSKVISDIYKKIESGLLLPNQKLPSERQMAVHYQVSRTVIREAIKVLSEKGLVEIKVGKGIYITKPTKNNVTEALQRVIHSSDCTIEDIIEVREELELSSVKKAIGHVTPKGLDKLRYICQKMDSVNIKISEFVNIDAQFHLAIAKLTGNNIFYLLINSFYEMTDKALFKTTHIEPSDIIGAQIHHWELISAIEKKDERKAFAIVRDHIDMIRNDVNLLRKRHLI